MNIHDDTTGRFSALGSMSEVFAETTRKEWFLHQSIFASLPSESVVPLLAEAELVQFKRKHRLFAQGEAVRHFLILGSGCVRVERDMGTRRVPLPIRGPGDCVGETALDAHYHHARETATTLSEVQALAVPMNALAHLAAQDAHLRKVLFAELDKGRLRAEYWLESLLSLDVEGRIAQVLTDALARFCEPHAMGKLIAAPLTHADLAGLIGSTRETVTLTLGKMKRAGVIDFYKRRVVVRDDNALKRCLTAA